MGSPFANGTPGRYDKRLHIPDRPFTHSRMSIEPEPTIVYYHCVCGNDVRVDPLDGGVCERCERHISATIVDADTTQTVCLSAQGLMPHGLRRDEAQEDALIGQQLGHFRVLARLGSGGMGSVYRAIDESLQRFVAIKVLNAATMTKKDSEQLLQEARAQARVNHPHIVHIYYVSRDEEQPFLAMEYVDGPTLLQRMSEGRLLFSEIMDVAIQTAEALALSTRFDIVHGDIKPANLLLAHNERVKLSDFGLSRRMSAAADPAEDRLVSGTPSYMAPEITRGEPVTPQSDQYALGVMLYQLTFDRLPFEEKTESVQEMIEAHRHESVMFPRPWPAHLPHRWSDVLNRLLAKSPEDRYPNYDELIDDLKRIRPQNLPTAGLVPRSLAWGLDNLLVLAFYGLLKIPTVTGPGDRLIRDFPTVGTAIHLLLCSVGLVVGWIQMTTGTTLGKKIFQIRIVNRYGLRPRPSKLFWRSVFQFLPVWAGCVAELLKSLQWAYWLDEVFVGIPLALGLLVQVLFVIFRRDRRAIHDFIFGTRVALDAGQ